MVIHTQTICQQSADDLSVWPFCGSGAQRVNGIIKLSSPQFLLFGNSLIKLLWNVMGNQPS